MQKARLMSCHACVSSKLLAKEKQGQASLLLLWTAAKAAEHFAMLSPATELAAGCYSLLQHGT
jgi:hypothetical protein